MVKTSPSTIDPRSLPPVSSNGVPTMTTTATGTYSQANYDNLAMNYEALKKYIGELNVRFNDVSAKYNACVAENADFRKKIPIFSEENRRLAIALQEANARLSNQQSAVVVQQGGAVQLASQSQPVQYSASSEEDFSSLALPTTGKKKKLPIVPIAGAAALAIALFLFSGRK